MSKPRAPISIGIPAVRKDFINVVLEAFDRGTHLPAEVILVTNEIEPGEVARKQFPVRVVGFDSKTYAYGFKDWAVRRNIGIWEASAPYVLCFDDDEIPARDLIETLRHKLGSLPYVWGHHRFTDFTVPANQQEASELITRLHSTPATVGRSREVKTNHRHTFLSGYGGLLGAPRDVITMMGGFDMSLNAHGGEDQAFARQLSHFCGGDGSIFVHEPPFAWCSNLRFPIPFIRRNICAMMDHDLVQLNLGGRKWMQCRKCPYGHFTDYVHDSRIVFPFNRAAVTTHESVVEAL